MDREEMLLLMNLFDKFKETVGNKDRYYEWSFQQINQLLNQEFVEINR